MKVLNYLFRCILIICISLSLVGLMAINVASNTILSYDYIISKLEQNNYYEETYKLVYSNFEKYIYQSGLDENIIENICTPQQVKEDIDIVIRTFDSGLDFLKHYIDGENSNAYDLIILDILMPKISGIDTAVALRKNDTKTPIVFIS